MVAYWFLIMSISIHALREEGDLRALCHRQVSQNFYPRPPRGGRLAPPIFGRQGVVISIHALREEGDCRADVVDVFFERFLSTPSARRATVIRSNRSLLLIISIHALREEGDHARNPEYPQDEEFLSTPSARRATPRICEVGNIKKDFYPRPPRGGRRSSPSAKASRPEFLSTPSARRATYKPDGRCNISGISIHALREEGDQGRLNAPE